MAKKKNGFDISALQKYGEQLEQLGGHDAIRQAVSEALRVSKMELNRQIEKKMQPGNLPAGGKYSTGDTLESLDRNYKESWSGNVATMGLGFDMSKSGITSIFLMYGTPKMRPVAGLSAVLKGSVAKKKIREDQEIALQQILARLTPKGG